TTRSSTTRTANGRCSTRPRWERSGYRSVTTNHSRSTPLPTSPTIRATWLAEYGWRVADLLDISSRIIDSGVVDQPVNRVTNELSELASDLAIVESFSHGVAFDSGDGLVCFDSSGVHTGEAVVAALKAWRPDRVGH